MPLTEAHAPVARREGPPDGALSADCRRDHPHRAAAARQAAAGQSCRSGRSGARHRRQFAAVVPTHDLPSCKSPQPAMSLLRWREPDLEQLRPELAGDEQPVAWRRRRRCRSGRPPARARAAASRPRRSIQPVTAPVAGSMRAIESVCQMLAKISPFTHSSSFRFLHAATRRRSRAGAAVRRTSPDRGSAARRCRRS